MEIGVFKSDAALYEMYYIMKYKPKKNEMFNRYDSTPNAKLKKLNFSKIYQLYQLPGDDEIEKRA